MSRTAFAIDQGTLYFSTVAGGATPVAANQVGAFDGEPVFNVTWATAVFRGQDRFASRLLMHDADATATIPGFLFDASEVMAKFVDGTNTGATTLHGGAAAATEVKIGKNSKPLQGEWLIEGTNSESSTLKVQILIHRAAITGIGPTLGGSDFSKLDLNLLPIADASGDVFSVFHS